jgi:NADPH-dependent F420 reductase
MRIGVLGSGSVGSSLARGFAREGHDVMVGTRDPSQESVQDWLRDGGEAASAGSYADAAGFAEIVIMAVPGAVLDEVVDAAGEDSFAGKVVIDPMNPVLFEGDEVRAAYGDDTSAAERLQERLPEAKVVKAFNQIEAARMTTPDESSGPLRICGDDPDAKAMVTELAEAFGWKVRDLGPLKRARPLERGVIDWIRGS